MKALQPLSFLIRHIPPLPRSSLPLPSLFHRAYFTQLSVPQSNRILQTRHHSTTTSSREAPRKTNSNQNAEDTSTSAVCPKFLHPKVDSPSSLPQPGYFLYFTCKPCGSGSDHRISKQGYHNGTVLVTCPGCNNRHVISDHLKIFSDSSFTIEDILRQKGETLKRGTINAEGDVEFFPDPSEVSDVSMMTEKDKITRLMKDAENRGQKIDTLFENTKRRYGLGEDLKGGAFE